MTSLFDDIAQFDDGFAANRREAAAVAHKRVQDTVGGYLRLSKSAEEYTARLNYVTDDIRQIVADVASEYNVDHDKLLNAIEENLKGDGVTDINIDLLDAPSAVGTGPKSAASDDDDDEDKKPEYAEPGKDGIPDEPEGTEDEKTSRVAGGHRDGCECGFCKNKGNIHKKDKMEGIVDDEEKSDKDASEPEFSEKVKEGRVANDFAFPPGAGNEMGGNEIYVRTRGGNLLGPFNNEQEALQAKDEEEKDELYRHGDPNQNPGEMPEGWDPRIGSSRVADAPRDGGGAVTREKLPKGDGKSIGDGPSPKMDKKRWKPNALNADGNLPAVPEGIEMDGSPVPTERQDLVDEERDYSRDFEDKIDAATTTQDLPSADETGASTERNISQDNQMGTWTEAQGDAVTPQVFASANEDNPLKAILDAGFASDKQVESAIEAFDSDKE